MHQFLFYNEFIIHLYTFLAQLCSKHVEVYNKLIIKQELVHEVGQLLGRWSVPVIRNRYIRTVIRLWESEISALQPALVLCFVYK